MVEMGTIRKEGFTGASSTGDAGLAANLMLGIAIAQRVTTHSRPQQSLASFLGLVSSRPMRYAAQ
jgi:hypothetical protein